MYGIRGVIYDLFKSYLLDRTQYVVIDGNTSETRTFNCGVPQGSILGPLLFLIYINDLCNTSSLLKYILFADDTSVYMTHNDIGILEILFNEEIDKITNWLKCNKLSVNISKTNYTIFTNKCLNNTHISIKLAGCQIVCESSLKFLGIIIDNKLTWKNHINVICNKISKGIGVMYKLHMLPIHILKMIYNAIVVPYLNYANIAWGNAADVYLSRLLKLQKRAIRIVNHDLFLAHTMPIFYSLKLLTFYDIYKYQLGVFMFLCYNKILPSCILNYFTLNLTIHSYVTRNAQKFHLPKVRTSLSHKSLLFQGPLLWNSLPDDIRESKSLNVFKMKYKQYLINTYTCE